MPFERPLDALAERAPRLVGLSHVADILVQACCDAQELVGARIAFATHAVRPAPWERGVHVGVVDGEQQVVAPRARSALFGVHRRLAATREPLILTRADDPAAIFDGLAPAPELTGGIVHAVPLLHRSGPLAGEIVLLTTSPGALSPESLFALRALAALTTVALANARRLAVAKRDQERLLFLAEATEEALWDWHIDTGDLWWGGGIDHLLRGGGEHVGRDPQWKFDRIHPADVARVKASFEACLLSTRSSWKEDYCFRRADQSWAFVEERSHFLRETTGRAYRTIGAIRDVSALHASNAALRQNEERLRAALEASEIGTYVWDIRSDDVFHDDGVKALFGFAPAEGGRLDDYGRRIHEGDRPAWLDRLARTSREGAAFHQEYRIVWPDGTTRWVLDKGRPVRGQDGSVSHVPGAVIDITSRKALEAEHEAAHRNAIEANRAKDEFLAMLGHELRNPLSPMLTALQLMRLQKAPSREQEVLERQVAHLTRLVDDLLDVSRITRGKVELRKKKVDVADVVVRALEIASPLLEDGGHELEVCAPRGLIVFADPDRLAQVFANLLTNAAKYSDRGSKIVVRSGRVGGTARVSVRDNGSGIEPEMIDRVFDLFVQRSQTLERSQGGLGLGLAIVKSLVASHDGQVSVRSDGIGKGSEFTVEIPAVEGGRDATATPLAPIVRRTERRGKRVLVVDDNVDAAELLTMALEALGYDVEIAHDGPTAIAIASRFSPNVALVDIGLPVMNGYELAPKLREQHANGEPLVLVAVTGYGREDDRRRAHAAGFDAHLVKPLDLATLEGALKRLEHGEPIAPLAPAV